MTALTLIGNLTADPEIRYTSGGLAVVGFTVAHTPRRLDKTTGQWVDGETLFMRCSIWRDAAEHTAESLHKGARVIAVGHVKARSYTTAEGDERHVVEMDCDEVGPSLRYATVTVKRAERVPFVPEVVGATG